MKDKQQVKELAQRASSHEPNYVVGIGASAGGLEALEALFDALPPDTGMAFVVIQHLSPDFKSVMDELIRRHTEMAVFRVENGMKVMPNAVYLIPAGKEMIIADGCLLLTDKDPAESLTLPIDHFFRSLANDCAERAVAIVMSGSGSDGSRGVRQVHEHGGLVMSQDAATAAFDSMPNATEETGIVKFIGAPDEIADALLRLANHPFQRAALSIDQPAVPEDGIKKILRVLRDTYGIDFTFYKPSTVPRRIERRLLLNHSKDLDAYLEAITNDSHELNQLYHDLLIGVTEFFRDPSAFKLLEEEILPDLLLRIPPEQEVRVWVAGCATGEEAYSLAILIHERLSAMNRPIHVRIFATDVHRTSLDLASAGIYSESAVAQLSPNRMKRYFTQTRDGFQISKDLRNMVVFAPHNLIKDAPFTRLDLISCRNLLIYLQPLAQKKVLSLFHFALKTGGALLLGPSETTGELAEEFDVSDAHWRVYRKRRDIRLPPDFRLATGSNASGGSSVKVGAVPDRSSFPIRTATRPATGMERELVGLYESLLSEFMPASLVIDGMNHLVHSFGPVNDLLRVPVGRASDNALDLLPADLRTVVIGAMQRVRKSAQPVTYNRVTVDTSVGKRNIRVTVRPLAAKSVNADFTLIVLEQSDPADDSPMDGDSVSIDDASRERIGVLENELRHSRESLQASIEEMESSNEELQATNEELVASNEELQSTNEELHSVNEELYTVNAEYQKKISELTELTHDMDNLLNSTDVHTLFLDEELCIRKFTPKMADEFNLIPSDIGRRIEGFSHNIPCEGLLEKLSDVLENGKRYEEEITTADRDHFLLRVLPYRGETNRSGVLLTLVDVTDSREAETRFRGTFENAAVGIAHLDLDGRLIRVNQRLSDILGYGSDELLMKSLHEITFPDDQTEEMAQFVALKRGDIDRFNLEERLMRKDGTAVWISLTVSLERDDRQLPIYAICVVQDISPRKTFEAELSKSISQRDYFLAMLSHELRNPLNAIVNATALLERQTDKSETSAKPKQVIRRQSARVARLLDDLLDVSRVTQGKIVLDRAVRGLNELAGEAIDSLDSLKQSHSHSIELKLAEDELWVEVDPSRILQVIENLLTNAFKYTPDGGIITVETGIEHCHSTDLDCAVLRVTDTGCGMTPELVNSVFDMFVQSDETLHRSEGGMGVGLTLVRSLLELHGGSISATSEGLGKGSQFVIRLPLTSLRPIKLELQQNTSGRGQTATTDNPRRLLLVEDNHDSRAMISELLGMDGFLVVAATDGEEGLQLLQQQMFEAALVDIGLPKLDGYEVARRFLEHCPENRPRLIALTGYGQESDIKEAKEAGFDDHLVKPVDAKKLTRLLNQGRG